MSQKFTPSSKDDLAVDQAIRVLTFIEKTAIALRQKIEKENKVPPWLIVRIQQLAVDIRLASPYLAPATKKKLDTTKRGD